MTTAAGGRPWPCRCCRTPGQWYNSLPPITRLLLTIYLATGLGMLFNLTPLLHMYLDWGLVLQLKKIPQVGGAEGST